MRAVKRQMLVNPIIPFVLATVTLSGCTLGTDISQPSTMAIVSGDSQTAAVNTPLPDSLTVVVVGSFYEPIENETVTWTVVAGGGSLTSPTSQTDVNGLAWTRYTAGSTAGAVKIQAKVGSLAPIFFDATVTP
ncbi:MAG TPA: hypothetical protein VIM36_00605 [Gemmatimonadaceae bacterium]|jgi:hypothetical protein